MVLIDMKMPKGCNDCPILQSTFGECFCPIQKGTEWKTYWVSNLPKDRPEECPIACGMRREDEEDTGSSPDVIF